MSARVVMTYLRTRFIYIAVSAVFCLFIVRTFMFASFDRPKSPYSSTKSPLIKNFPTEPQSIEIFSTTKSPLTDSAGNNDKKGIQNAWKEEKLITAKGMKSYEEINKNVFKKLGYEIEKMVSPIPQLRFLKPSTCEKVFADWYKISKKQQPSSPPKNIAPDHVNELLLYGYVDKTEWYLAEALKAGDTRKIEWNYTADWMKLKPSEVASKGYGESLSVHHAFVEYPINGQRGFVVGSQSPWVEVLALQQNASFLTTVEYHPINIPEDFADRMAFISAIEFVRQWKRFVGTFDFAVTFSSIEHSGLGRYGDVIDPIGDLREMQKIHCMLKPGGIAYVAVPIGRDHLVFNAHRIYGPLRLSLLFAGFEYLGTYSADARTQPNFDTTPGTYYHFTAVLRKI